MTQKYPDEIMERCRKRLDLQPDDTSRDDEINMYSPREAFTECCNWEGIIGWADTFMDWIEHYFNINLDEFYE